MNKGKIQGNWYGIPDLRFVWNGSTADATVIYKDRELNTHPCEDTMWERYSEECEENHCIANYDDFDTYMLEHQDEVKELLDMYECTRKVDKTMLLKDILPFINENINVDVLDNETGEIISQYDGRNSIDTKFNSMKVVTIYPNSSRTMVIQVIVD